MFLRTTVNVTRLCIGAKIWKRTFFSQTFGRPRDIPARPGISRQKSLVSLVSRDIPKFLAPTHSRGRPPPEDIWTQKLGFVLFFFCTIIKRPISGVWGISKEPSNECARVVNYFGVCSAPAIWQHLIAEILLCSAVFVFADISAPKKIFGPPPKIPQFAADTLSSPRPHPPPGHPPPSWDFQCKTDPHPPPGTSDTPSAFPTRKKKKTDPKRPPSCKDGSCVTPQNTGQALRGIFKEIFLHAVPKPQTAETRGCIPRCLAWEVSCPLAPRVPPVAPWLLPNSPSRLSMKPDCHSHALGSSPLPPPEKGVITKGVFSLEDSLESLDSLDSLENVGFSFVFHSRGSLESLNSLKSLENGLFWKGPFSKRLPFSEPDPYPPPPPNRNRSRYGKPNKKRQIRKPVGKRRGVFVFFWWIRCENLEKQEEFTKTAQTSENHRFFCEFSLLFQEKTFRVQKSHPFFASRFVD